MLVYVDAAIRLLLVEYFLISFVAYNISVFVLSICIQILLNCVICQMDSGVVDIVRVNTIIRAWHPDVAFLENVEILILVKEHPHSKIKLALHDKLWPLYVLLNNKIIVFNLKCSFIGGCLGQRCLEEGLVERLQFLEVLVYLFLRHICCILLF